MGTAVTTRRGQDPQTQSPIFALTSIEELRQPFRPLIHAGRWPSPSLDTLLSAGFTASMVEAANAAIAPYLRPAEPSEVAALMTRLRLHYPDWKRHTEAEMRLVAEDWIEDLAGRPIGLLVEACRIWRQSGQRNAPNTGQLLSESELIASSLARFKDQIEQAQLWIEHVTQPDLWAAAESSLASMEAELEECRRLASEEERAEAEDIAAGHGVDFFEREHHWPEPSGWGQPKYWRVRAEREATLLDSEKRRLARDKEALAQILAT